jgi:hypothetical protein
MIPFDQVASQHEAAHPRRVKGHGFMATSLRVLIALLPYCTVLRCTEAPL